MKKAGFLSLFVLFVSASFAQIIVGFQGGEPGDTWGFTSTGASATALNESTQSANIVSGSASLVVGGNTGGGSCIDGGSGNGPDTFRKFTFDPLDISSSSNFTRTFSISWGNRFPVCFGTGWDDQEDLVITVYHDGVAQTPVTVALGNNNATFSIQTHLYTVSIPVCVNSFHFEIGVTTNRRDELLFIDNAKVTTPSLNNALVPGTSITGDTEVCEGTVQTLNAASSPNVSYLWSGLPAGASFTSPNGTTASSVMDIDWGTAAPGTYTISVTPSILVCGGANNGTPATIDVTVMAIPQLSVTSDTTICSGEPVLISASGAASYTWDNGLGSGSSFTVNPTSTTSYHVIGENGDCTATASVTITLLPALNISLSASSTTICEGGSSQLTAGGAGSYTWQPASTLSAATGTSVSATPAATTTYTVTGTTGACSGTAAITITVVSVSVNAGNDQVVCAGNPVTLNAAGANSYSWDHGVTNGVPFVPVTSGTYTVTATIGACSDSDALDITLEELPLVSFSSDTEYGCLPLEVNFGTVPDPAIIKYEWDFGDGNLSSAPNPVHTYMFPGCNDVSLRMTSVNGCSQSLVMKDYICSAPTPTASFTVDPDELERDNPQATMQNTSQNANAYSWDFGDFSTSAEVSPGHVFAALGENYVITLVAYHVDGCTDTARLILPFAEELIYYVPNAFTPDGNNFNNLFQPVFTEGFDPGTFRLEIFNRWGELLFESGNAEIGWDGTFGNRPAPDGVYTWKIAFSRDKDMDQRVITGHVLLFR